MKERPILFSAPMVRAILSGQKTQTRRIVNPQPTRLEWFEHQKGWLGSFGDDAGSRANPHRMVPCPYGQPGDRLWVREPYWQFGNWEPIENVKTTTGKQKWRFCGHMDAVSFESPAQVVEYRFRENLGWHARLGRFMPRWASRLTLEITDIRVERLNDITEDDAKAEGIVETELGRAASEALHTYKRQRIAPAVLQFADLWNSINGPASWDANPHVWVISFRPI